MVRTTAEIATEIDDLKQRVEATTLELEARLDPVTKRARWAILHRRELSIAAGFFVVVVITASLAARRA